MSVETIINIIAEYIYPAVLVLFFFGLTIFIHELGHFLVAKRRGLKIERFSLGFGPAIWSKTVDGVEYRISWLPFGGYVALPQMGPMEAVEGKNETKPEELPPVSPESKILVAIAGPLLNLVLAVVFAFVIWGGGLAVPVEPPIVGWVQPGSVEEQMGIVEGDRILQVDDQKIETWSDIIRAVTKSLQQDVRLVIDRRGERKEFLVPSEHSDVIGSKTINVFPSGRPSVRAVIHGKPAEKAGLQKGDQFLAVEGVAIVSSKEFVEWISKATDQPTKLKILRGKRMMMVTVLPEYDAQSKAGRIGVELTERPVFRVQHPGPSLKEQGKEVIKVLGDTVYVLRHHKETGVGVSSFQGPVGIAGGWWWEIRYGGITRGVRLAVIINVLIALFNLLPIPVLDGGHILFSLIEKVIGRALNQRFVYVVSTAFATLLIGFMLFVTFNDFKKFLPEKQKPAASIPATNDVPDAPVKP